MFYDGHPKEEPGALVCRLSPSFIRFGNFQIHGARGETDLLRQLVDYTIRTDFPHLGSPGKQTYLCWFQEVCDRTRTLVIHWMRTGFVHGVMNTDNMSILGLTLDYGPYGWLEGYDPVWTPNTTDARTRRYCFQNQGQIALWNLAQLANAVYPLISDDLPLKQILTDFSTRFQQDWLHLYHRRISEERLPRDVITKNMNRQNPWFVLRNYLAQMAIDKAHAHDFSMIHDLLDVMKNPYENQPGKELFAAKRPEWARHRPGCSMLSCSS